jgi:hypothetical protein
MLATHDPCLVDAVQPLASLAGVCLIHGEDMISSRASGTVAVLYGMDLDADAGRRLGEGLANTPAATVGFGPAGTDDGETQARAHYDLPGNVVGLLAFLERSARPVRHGMRVGILGAHGGVGATSLAIAVARLAARRGRRAALVDLDPAGGPLGAHVGLDGDEAGWPDLLAAIDARSDASPWPPSSDEREGGHGSVDAAEQARIGATRVRRWAEHAGHADLYVVTGARRLDFAIPGHRIRTGIEAVEEAGQVAITVIDASPGGPIPVERLAGWCERMVVVATDDAVGQAAAEGVIGSVRATACPVTLVRRAGPGRRDRRSQGGTPRGVSDVIVLGEETGMGEAGRHGVLPGDRPRGAVAACAADLADSLDLVGQDAGRVGRRRQPHGRRRADHTRRVAGPDGTGVDAIVGVSGDAAGLVAFGSGEHDDTAIPTGGVFVGSVAAGRREKRVAWRTSRPQGGRIGLWDEEW